MKKERYYNIIKRPLVTEKSTMLQEKKDAVYTFEVALDSKKDEIKDALEALFEVKVADIKTMIIRGKVKRRMGRFFGKRSNWKKAYVTLKEGTISFVEGL